MDTRCQNKFVVFAEEREAHSGDVERRTGCVMGSRRVDNGDATFIAKNLREKRTIKRNRWYTDSY